MKLNMDCVRAVMLCIEQNTDFEHYCYFIHYSQWKAYSFIADEAIDPPAYQIELEKSFDNDDILYSIHYCAESGLIKLGKTNTSYRIPVLDLTAAGHNFLENIRDERNWKKIKQVASKIGALSLDVVVGIGKDVVLSLAKQALSSI